MLESLEMEVWAAGNLWEPQHLFQLKKEEAHREALPRESQLI